jgi:hypothetical protein
VGAVNIGFNKRLTNEELADVLTNICADWINYFAEEDLPERERIKLRDECILPELEKNR